MSEDRRFAIGLALKAILSAARKQGFDLDLLTGSAVSELLRFKAYDSVHIPMAVCEIESAVKAIQIDR